MAARNGQLMLVKYHRIFADGDRSYPRDRDFDNFNFRSDVARFWQNKPDARFASEV